MRCLSKFPDTERTTPWRDMIDPDVRAGTSSEAEDSLRRRQTTKQPPPMREETAQVS
jgi:hypothetical protein